MFTNRNSEKRGWGTGQNKDPSTFAGFVGPPGAPPSSALGPVIVSWAIILQRTTMWGSEQKPLLHRRDHQGCVLSKALGEDLSLPFVASGVRQQFLASFYVAVSYQSVFIIKSGLPFSLWVGAIFPPKDTIHIGNSLISYDFFTLP